MTAGEHPGDSQLSPLEILHPDGRVGRALVLGGGRVPFNVPGAPAPGTEAFDLIVLAPDESDWLARTPAGWLPELRRVAQDGFVYSVVSRGRRRALRRLLSQAGLEVELAIAHVPGSEARYLVPVGRASAGSFRSSGAVAPRQALFLDRGPRALGCLLPVVALVARRPRSRRLADWALRLEPGTGDWRLASIARRGRQPEDRLVVERASARGGAATIVKIGLAGRAPDRRLEHRALEQLGGGARAAGALVPAPLAALLVDGRTVLVETALAGRPAAGVLGSRPNLLGDVLASVGAWLERWQLETREVRALEPADVRRLIGEPLAVLASLLEPRYVQWLDERCRALTGSPCTFVAAHRDLTMFNVLLDGRRLGVVDWETAGPQELPLCDLSYASVDAAAAADGYRDRLGAYERAFGTGPVADHVERLRSRLCSALDLDDALAELCSHATWLHHAANERREGQPGAFLAILRRLALDAVGR